jgi:YtkA-like
LKKWIVGIVLISFVLAGCGNSDAEIDGNEGVPGLVEASLEVPESAGLNEEVSFTVTVTQSGEAVDDADEVVFEIWKGEERERSEEIEAEVDGEGKYTVKKSFSEDGIYSVQSHVTARDFHTMPKKTIAIGNAEKTEQDGQTEEDHEDHEHH